MRQAKNLWTILIAIILQNVCPSLSAQTNNYDNDVEQYCSRISSHPLHCNIDYKFGGFLYGGLMMSSTSGDVSGKNTLGGVDLGLKLTNTWGYTCKPVQFILNAYLDVKYATYLSTSDESNHTNDVDYAAQVTIAPGFRYGRISVDCGPYIAYSAYKDDFEECFTDPDVAGMELGLRMGLSVHFEKVQVGLRYDIGLSDHGKEFKKKDLMLTVGFPLEVEF